MTNNYCTGINILDLNLTMNKVSTNCGFILKYFYFQGTVLFNKTKMHRWSCYYVPKLLLCSEKKKYMLVSVEH